MEMANSSYRAMRELFEPRTEDEILHFGVDWDGPLPEDTTEDTVEVPQVRCPLEDDELEDLISAIDPVQEDDIYGISVYQDVIDFVNTVFENRQ
ncbi:uncharacterized protein [Ptychodera flava]|uniref:uncharacterized protein n=1 Tax=Ptychodera flava TaxID=63121 RepID=UPI003969C0BF